MDWPAHKWSRKKFIFENESKNFYSRFVNQLLLRHRLANILALCLLTLVRMTLLDLNLASEQDFTAALGAIYEHSPWVAGHAAAARPFPSVAALQHAMRQGADAAPEDARVALIRAHPDLASRLACAPASAAEQAGLGLDRLSEAEFAEFQGLNAAYWARFGFPFVIAVKSHTRASVLAAFRQRLTQDAQTEIATAISEIHKIAGFRLSALLEPQG